jgi:hypothetical protein
MTAPDSGMGGNIDAARELGKERLLYHLSGFMFLKKDGTDFGHRILSWGSFAFLSQYQNLLWEEEFGVRSNDP